MKNQYVGDKRDLFKYDFARKVCQELGLGFTFIRMLTAPDGRSDGNQFDLSKARAGRVLNIIGDMITFDVQFTNCWQGFYVLCGCEVGTKHGTVSAIKCRVEYPDVAKFARRAGRTAIAPVLKTGVRKDLGVRTG
jgi:hypothetical protein